MKKIVLILMTVFIILLGLALVSCNKELIQEEFDFPSYETLGLSGGIGDSTRIVFESEASFNVIEITEDGNNIESFSLFELLITKVLRFLLHRLRILHLHRRNFL